MGLNGGTISFGPNIRKEMLRIPISRKGPMEGTSTFAELNEFLARQV